MFRAIAEVFGLARDVLRRRSLGKFDTEWKKNQEEIKESLGDRDPNSCLLYTSPSPRD